MIKKTRKMCILVLHVYTLRVANIMLAYLNSYCQDKKLVLTNFYNNQYMEMYILKKNKYLLRERFIIQV